jgi:hypothetical protein
MEAWHARSDAGNAGATLPARATLPAETQPTIAPGAEPLEAPAGEGQEPGSDVPSWQYGTHQPPEGAH